MSFLLQTHSGVGAVINGAPHQCDWLSPPLLPKLFADIPRDTLGALPSANLLFFTSNHLTSSWSVLRSVDFNIDLMWTDFLSPKSTIGQQNGLEIFDLCRGFLDSKFQDSSVSLLFSEETWEDQSRFWKIYERISEEFRVVGNIHEITKPSPSSRRNYVSLMGEHLFYISWNDRRKILQDVAINLITSLRTLSSSCDISKFISNKLAANVERHRKSVVRLIKHYFKKRPPSTKDDVDGFVFLTGQSPPVLEANLKSGDCVTARKAGAHKGEKGDDHEFCRPRYGAPTSHWRMRRCAARYRAKSIKAIRFARCYDPSTRPSYTPKHKIIQSAWEKTVAIPNPCQERLVA